MSDTVNTTQRQRLDAAAERYRDTDGVERDAAWRERQAALQEIVAEHARWVRLESGSARANLAGAYLARANFARADLAGANLARANFARANFARADLVGADLAGANLAGADLAGANLAGANLARANFARANLAGANLARANFARANFARANLARAYLAPIWDDIDSILVAARAEVPALLSALREGRVDGSAYVGPCACLIGTLANARGCDYSQIEGVTPNPERAAERWFNAIRRGDTPATNPVSALTVAHVEQWLASQVGAQ